jgi:hypothetical protein
MRIPLLTTLLGGLALVASVPEHVAAQSDGAVLVVEVRSVGAGEPLRGAQVSVEGLGSGGITDPRGQLRLSVPEGGIYTVTVRSVGFNVEQQRVRIAAGETRSVVFALKLKAVALPEVRIRASKGMLRLANTGFYSRQAGGIGQFVTRSQIEARRPGQLSDMLRGMPGVQLRPTAFRDSQASMGRTPTGARRCSIQYFIDGVPTVAGFNIDDIPPGDIEALEIYYGSSQIPVQFNRQNAICGVIVVWTRID